MKASRFIILRKHRESAERASRPSVILRRLGLTLLTLLLSAAVGLGLNYALFSQSFPPLEPFREHYTVKPKATQFYARDGETLLFTLAYENFETGDLAICETDGVGCFPKTFTEAAMITRDDKVRRGEARPIPEEMVRKVYAEEITASRYPNLLVRILTRQITDTFGEKQLLTWYFNTAWFGQMAFGLDAAARLYLDKPGDSLNDAECILLSAVINSPMLNPIDSKGALRDSYLQHLSVLHQEGLFSDETADALSRNNFTIFEPPHYTGNSEPDIITRKALDAVVNRYGREQVERGGMKVITSEDARLQAYLSCITSSLSPDEKKAGCPLSPAFEETEIQNAAEALQTAPVSIAVLDVSTGQLLALLEGQSDRENRRSYSSALQAYSIGSTMNFFAALTAFSGGSAPSTLLWDLENSYERTNSAGQSDLEAYHGPVSLREALTHDYQRPLTAHLRTFGSGAVQRNAALFGLTNSHMLTENDFLYKGSTDTAEAVAYSLIPFSTLGKQTGTDSDGSMHPISILRIEMEDGSDEVPHPTARKSLIADGLAYLVHHVFSQSEMPVSLPGRPAAVKIGSIPGEESLWISGYTTQISTAIRVGNPRTVSAFVTDTDRVQGTAAILWRSVMEYAHRELPASGWEAPADIARVRVCLPSGKLPTSACRETATEVFLRGNEPYEYDEYYVNVPINRENRMLATRYTPQEDVETAVFMNLPAEAADWASANGIESMPTEYDPIRDESKTGAVRIESPVEFKAYASNASEKIDIIVRLNLPSRPESLQVSIGSGMYPVQWKEVCTGGSLENGQWRLCSLDPSALEPGLYVIRTAFTLPNQVYRYAETYFEVQ